MAPLGVNMTSIERSHLHPGSEIAHWTRNGLAMIAAQISSQAEKRHVRFLISGCFNTALTFVIYCTGILLGINYLIANSIAWIVGIIVSFSLNSKFVFQKTYSHRRFISFALSNVFALLLSMALLSLIIRIGSVNPILASVITIPIVVVANFLTAKYVVFR
jgi:putative flippase GtrA